MDHLPSLPQESPPATRLSLAEEQQRDFEDSRKRVRRSLFSLRLPGQIFRN